MKKTFSIVACLIHAFVFPVIAVHPGYSEINAVEIRVNSVPARVAQSEESRIVARKIPPRGNIPPVSMPYSVPEQVQFNTADEETVVTYDSLTGEERIFQLESVLRGRGFRDGYQKVDPGFMEKKEPGKSFTNMIKIQETDIQPWSMNVRLLIDFVDDTGHDHWFSGSGSMIDYGIVLTAGHCVYNYSDGYGWAEQINIFPGSRIEHGEVFLPFGSSVAMQFETWAAWANNGNPNHDIGIIKFDRAMGAMTGWFGMDGESDCSVQLAHTFFNASYPSESCPDPGLHNGLEMYYWTGSFDACFDYQLQLDTGGGNCFDTVWGGWMEAVHFSS